MSCVCTRKMADDELIDYNEEEEQTAVKTDSKVSKK